MSVQIEVKGDKALIRKLNRLIDPRMFGAALAASSEVFIGFANAYPSQSGKPFKFVSQKQRRYVMMAIRKGLIQVPYRRKAASGGLMGGWSFNIATSGVSLESTITNAMPYGGWVMSPTAQAQYHQGNWKNTDVILNESIPQISRIWEHTFDRMLGAA